MNKRIVKKVEKRRRDKIHELLDLTLDINSTMPREQEKTGNKPTAFFNFSGHCGILTVQIYDEGWKARIDASKELWIHTYCTDELNEAIRQMKQQLCATK